MKLNARLSVPMKERTLELTRCRFDEPAAALSTTALDDVHTVASLVDTPIAARSLLAPALVDTEPTTVTEAQPVPGPFAGTAADKSTIPTVMATLRLPTSLNIVRLTPVDRSSPAAAFDTTLLSDVQAVLDKPLPDTRDAAL